MNWLQIRSFGPYFSSFLAHSYGYEPANELKSVLEASNFHFSPYRPTDSWVEKERENEVIKNVRNVRSVSSAAVSCAGGVCIEPRRREENDRGKGFRL